MRMALYKKPQGNKAVIMPKVADWESGEYWFIALINLVAKILGLLPFDFNMKNIWPRQMITIIRANFFADKSKNSLKRRAPTEPAKKPIMV